MGLQKIGLDEQYKIIDLYKNGISVSSIAKDYNVSPYTIYSVLNKHGIKTSRRKYKVNEHYFDLIDTANKAYILGFLYSDGTNSLKNHQVAISLQEQDKHILDDINKEIENELPLRFYDLKRKNKNNSNQFRLTINSKYMSDVLNSLGVIPNKSLHLTFPCWLDEKLYSHFIRGYMDGDGWISKNPSAPRIELVGTESFCQSVANIMVNKFNINPAIRKRYKESDTTTRQLDFGGRKQVKTFLDWIYKDADLYLERKYNIYKSIFLDNDINNSLLN